MFLANTSQGEAAGRCLSIREVNLLEFIYLEDDGWTDGDHLLDLSMTPSRKEETHATFQDLSPFTTHVHSVGEWRGRGKERKNCACNFSSAPYVFE